MIININIYKYTNIQNIEHYLDILNRQSFETGSTQRFIQSEKGLRLIAYEEKYDEQIIDRKLCPRCFTLWISGDRLRRSTALRNRMIFGLEKVKRSSLYLEMPITRSKLHLTVHMRDTGEKEKEKTRKKKCRSAPFTRPIQQ